MSRYVAAIVYPDGNPEYLCRGRFASYERATRYPHPSNARQAVDRYAKAHPRQGDRAGIVYDLHDPERGNLY